jgi:serine/threonine-protein kinase
VLLPPRKSHVSTIKGFVKEAKIHGLLEHPNIIPLHELGLLHEAGLFFTMKQVQGETLTEILTAIKRGNPDYLEKYTTYALLSIFRKVCDAIAYAHSLGIIHQDIKPDNIIVGQYGEVFLIDWGAARVVGDVNKEGLAQFLLLKDMQAETESGSLGRLQGTPSFMSPEQACSERHEVDIRSDIFLLGATLYTIFTLTLPYMGKTVSDVLQKAKTRKLIPPDQRSPERQIPEEACRIILKAMAYHKTDRYQTVEALAQDIDLLIAGRWPQQDTREFRTGDTLMQEGDVGEEAYLILDGSVLVTKERGGTSIVLGIYQEGDIVGEMSLISEEPRSATISPS